MSESNSKIIRVRAAAKRNGFTTLVIGFGILGLSVLWLSIAPASLNIPGFFLSCAGLVTLLIGLFKIKEPEHSITITPTELTYLHRLGQWRIPWSSIQRFDQPRVTKGLEQKTLNFIGFKITDYEGFVSSISPRLATHLLMEQRPLLLQNPDKACTTGNCAGGDILNDTKFKLASGKMLTGVQAMLANRMRQLRESLGYDIYIAAAELDREPSEFIDLLKSCQTSRFEEASEKQ
jgi:hypothetical protein